ncbi:TetR/AcrR family transcriptional regulator [Nocardia brasiliensis]|uniref:TetR/AcrR family transcriptional regulator n=1 Tax=Nocardia brasiliensis TaxID=37326 RepID=UPI00366EE378
MTTTPSRLSKQARREQLLDTAITIVRTEGADGLTLPTLSEAAGVSRPIVYDHFANRPSLLLALYQRLYEAHRAASAKALSEAANTLEDIAEVISAAYFACAVDMPEFNAISAALKGNPETEAIHHAMFDSYLDAMVAALRPHADLTTEALRLRCVGLIGAAEAIGTELNLERVTRDDAAAALTDLIVRSLATKTCE